MEELRLIHDIVEENGKTIKENNLERMHKIPIGTLVEMGNGVRMFVSAYRRDCDGSPLYSLSYDNDPWQWQNNPSHFHGFGEDGLKIIKKMV